MGISNLCVAGGIVMYPLLVFSLMAIALIIERCLFWDKIDQQQSRMDKLRLVPEVKLDIATQPK